MRKSPILPALALGLFEGELAPGGRASSVYTLDTSAMTQVKQAGKDEVLRLWIKPGDSVKLPGNRGTITFDRVERWAGLSIRHDPAKNFTLLSALLALGALIAQLTIKRRRVFVRMTPDGDRNRVVVAALSKTDDDGRAILAFKLPAKMERGVGSLSARSSSASDANCTAGPWASEGVGRGD